MRKIWLTGKFSGKFAAVDDLDFEYLSGHKWCTSHGYPVRRSGNKMIYLHRQILNCRSNLTVDHIDGDKLNCRRGNLRICTQSDNCKNKSKSSRGTSSKYKGVHWHRVNKKWRVTIKVNYKKIHLGMFDDEQGAAAAYDIAAVKYFGRFAKLNFQQTR